MKKIHFIGINGSGISGVACIAKARGYEVTGCDINEKGDYTEQLLNSGIKPMVGHDISHLADVDVVVTSPALLYHGKYKTIEETRVAMEQGKMIKWQKFLGNYIMQKEKIVAIAGTHGKTTTTTLIALLTEAANLDPTVFVGGIIKEWGTTYRIGNSDCYVCEADEYDGNFLNYYPRYVILTNLEMEHPERFNNIEEYFAVFVEFLKNIQDNGTLIFNADDELVMELIQLMKEDLAVKNVKLIGYSFNEINNSKFLIVNAKFDKTSVTINCEKYDFSVLGEHNARNISTAIITALEMGIKPEVVKEVIKDFKGPKRRLDLLFQNDKIKLYDDYAHHHTQVKVTIDALKENLDSNEKIIAILEPHMISRIQNNPQQYKDSLLMSDYPIITKIFKSREGYKDDIDLVRLLDSDKILYIENFEDIITEIDNILNHEDNCKYSILVMGAGNSYKLAKSLREKFEKNV